MVVGCVCPEDHAIPETLCDAQLALIQQRVLAEQLLFQEVKVWGLQKSRFFAKLLQAENCPQLVSWDSGGSTSIYGKEYITLSCIPCVFFNFSVSILLSVAGEVLCYVLSPFHEHIS